MGTELTSESQTGASAPLPILPDDEAAIADVYKRILKLSEIACLSKPQILPEDIAQASMHILLVKQKRGDTVRSENHRDSLFQRVVRTRFIDECRRKQGKHKTISGIDMTASIDSKALPPDQVAFKAELSDQLGSMIDTEIAAHPELKHYATTVHMWADAVMNNNKPELPRGLNRTIANETGLNPKSVIRRVDVAKNGLRKLLSKELIATEYYSINDNPSKHSR